MADAIAIDTSTTPALQTAYRGSGIYLVAETPDGPVIERCLGPAERQEWVSGRYYAGRPTRKTQALIDETRRVALAAFDAQVAAFRAAHPGCRVSIGMGSSTAVYYAPSDAVAVFGLPDEVTKAFWRVAGRAAAPEDDRNEQFRR